MTTMKTGAMTVMRMRTKSRHPSLVPSATLLGGYSSLHPIPREAYTYTYTFALHPRSVRKPTTKSAPMKSKSRQREMDRAQDDDDDDDGSGASEPADSIIDSGSEEDADNEVDGMLGE
jgi:hypothetical protein